jgi:putative transposase
MADDELLTAIGRESAESPFVGEGHNKLRARLALEGDPHVGKRVLRLTCGAGLLAPTAKVRKRAKRLQDGTIT